jgi:hypothetical protein
MNREEASHLISMGKDNIEKLGHMSAKHELYMWVENWEMIKAYSEGSQIRCKGRLAQSPNFMMQPEKYEIAETQINWKKVVENDGLHVRLVVDGAVCRLIGVSKSGSPIVQSEEGRGFFEARISVFFHDEVVPKPEWYELAEGE